MDRLREWLNTTIQHELCNGLKWLESKSSDPNHVDSSSFEDDGSNLRVKSCKPRVVQIIKVVTFEKPVQLWVSDNDTRLKATFASSAVQRFHDETGKRLTQNTLGGLIQIVDFEIVGTHLVGRRSSKITILVKNFQFLGFGSTPFVIPRPVDALPELNELLARLEAFRKRESLESHKLTSRGVATNQSPICSSVDINYSSDDNHRSSQNEFATQPAYAQPHSRPSNRPELRKLMPKENSRHDDFNPTMTCDFASKPKDQELQKITSGSTIKGSNGLDTVEAAVSIQNSYLPQNTKAKNATNKLKPPINALELLDLLQPNLVPRKTTHSSLEAKQKNLPEIINPEIEDQEVSGEASKVTVEEFFGEGGDENSSVEDLCPILKSCHSDSQLSAHVQPKTNHENSKYPKPPTDNDLKSSQSKRLNHHEPMNTSLTFQIPKRISMRDVNIPKDQKILLESSDSWLPSKPGQRQPVANIPIKTLQTITDFVESHARDTSKGEEFADNDQKKKPYLSNKVVSEPQKESSTESDDEIPISSGQWPPSPPVEEIHEQLPPDSSIEVLDLPVHSQTKLSGKEIPITKRRKLSSPVASPTRPNHNYKVQTQKILENTHLSSPASTVSAVTISGAPYRCTLNGCKVSCKEHLELTMHMASHQEELNPDGNLHYENAPGSEGSADSSVKCRTCADCHDQPILGEIVQHASESRGAICTETLKDDLIRAISPRLPARIDRSLSTLSPEATQSSSDGDDSPLYYQRKMKPEKGHILPGIFPNHNNSQTSKPHSILTDVPNKQAEQRSKPTSPQHIGVADLSSNNRPTTITGLERLGSDPNPMTSTSQASKRENDTCINVAPMRCLPITSRVKEPVLQVKGTPYISGNLSKIPPSDFTSPPSPLERKLVSPLSAIQDEQTKKSSSDSAVLDPLNTNSADVETNLERGRGTLQSMLVKNSPKPKSRSCSFVKARTPNQVEDGTFSTSSESQMTSMNLLTIDVSMETNGDISKSKRKASDSQLLQTNILKRRKQIKHLADFKFSQDPQNMRDPSTLGRENRQQFFQSRKFLASSPEEEMTPSALPASTPAKSQALQISGFHDTTESADAQEAIISPSKIQIQEGVYVSPRQIQAKSKTSLLQSGLDDINTREIHGRDELCPYPADPKSEPTRMSIFDRFKIAYPDYVGCLEHFLNICKRIEKLVVSDRMEHPSLWDDFIVRHQTEYPSYVNRCLKNADDPVTFEKFYHTEIDEPRYTDRVITPKNLPEALSLGQQIKSNKDQQQPHPFESNETTISPRLTTNLNSDAEASLTSQGAFVNRSPRPLPWIAVNGVQERKLTKKQVSTTESLSGRTSGTLHQMNQASKIRISKDPNSAKTSPLGSKRYITKTSRLSTPSMTISSNVSKGKLFDRARINSAASSTPTSSALSETLKIVRTTGETAKDLINPYGRRIDSSSFSNFATTHTSDGTPEHLSPLKDRTPGTLPRPTLTKQARQTADSRHNNSLDEYWRDSNSRFNSFAKAYKAIRSGNGNSFSVSNPILSTSNEERDGKINSASSKQLNVLKWQL